MKTCKTSLIFSFYSLKSKLIALFTFLFFMVIFIVFFVSLSQQKQLLSEEIEKRGKITAAFLALSARDAVLEKDLLTLNALVGATQKDGDILHIAILDHRNVVIMHSDVTKISSHQKISLINSPITQVRSKAQNQKNPNITIKITEPIQMDGKKIGEVNLLLSKKGIEDLIQDAKINLYKTMGLGLVLGMTGILLLAKVFLKPVRVLAKATQEIAEGNLDVFVPIKARDEIGRLGSSFNIMTSKLKFAYEEVERGNIAITLALAAAVEAKDPYTRGHCGRVSAYSIRLGKFMGLSQNEKKELELASILHDIGKIGVKDDILTKPGRLTLKEMQIMQLHPQIGRQIMEKVEPLHKIAEYTLFHHEHLDGKGYPQGLKGEKIPLISRIITIADSFDAMSTSRPYREALPEGQAIERLIKGKGRQFDPDLVDYFTKLWESGVIHEIRNQYSENE
ncbi:MAG TPA: HD domain-containing phosphohydrolase [Nitrospiria bacterium]